MADPKARAEKVAAEWRSIAADLAETLEDLWDDLGTNEQEYLGVQRALERFRMYAQGGVFNAQR